MSMFVLGNASRLLRHSPNKYIENANKITNIDEDLMETTYYHTVEPGYKKPSISTFVCMIIFLNFCLSYIIYQHVCNIKLKEYIPKYTV